MGKGQIKTYENQWVWIIEERKLAMKRDPRIAYSQKAWNARYSLWHHPDEPDPASLIIRNFGQQADIRTWHPGEIAGIILKDGRRCLNQPVLPVELDQPRGA